MGMSFVKNVTLHAGIVMELKKLIALIAKLVLTAFIPQLIKLASAIKVSTRIIHGTANLATKVVSNATGLFPQIV